MLRIYSLPISFWDALKTKEFSPCVRKSFLCDVNAVGTGFAEVASH